MAREWNAGEYERLADPMTRWGGQVLERLALTGNETVLLPLPQGRGRKTVSAKGQNQDRFIPPVVRPEPVRHCHFALTTPPPVRRQNYRNPPQQHFA